MTYASPLRTTSVQGANSAGTVRTSRRGRAGGVHRGPLRQYAESADGQAHLLRGTGGELVQTGRGARVGAGAVLPDHPQTFQAS